MINKRISTITSIQLHMGGPSQHTKSRKNKKYQNCDRIKMLFSTDDIIEYVENPKEFTTKLLE